MGENQKRRRNMARGDSPSRRSRSSRHREDTPPHKRRREDYYRDSSDEERRRDYERERKRYRRDDDYHRSHRRRSPSPDRYSSSRHRDRSSRRDDRRRSRTPSPERHRSRSHRSPSPPPSHAPPPSRTTETKTSTEPSKSAIDIASIRAKLAASKAAVAEKKKAILGSEGTTSMDGSSPASSKPAMETSEAAKLALRVAEERLKSRAMAPLPSLGQGPAGGFTAEQMLALESVQIKDSLINRRLTRKKLDLDVAPPDDKSTKYYDPRMAPRKERDRRAFHFVTPGTFVRQGQNMRAELFTNQSHFNEADPLNRRLFAQLRRDPVPSVEWWDKIFLPKSSHALGATDHPGYGDLAPEHISLEHVTHYVEHPVPEKMAALESQASANASISFLTEKEKKKLRRIRREEVQKEKQIKVMLGLEKPEDTRVTLTNMTRVYGAQALEDPTKIDQMVREQMKARLDKHLQANEERKLTPEHRREKKLEKLRRNESGEVQVVVFKIKDLSSPLHRKNIDHTTRDGALTGVLVICEDPEAANVLVAEGAPRAIKKLRRLMTARLKWTDTRPDNTCDLVWEGVLPKRHFKKFRFHECPTATEARQVLAERNQAHYWDTALAFSDALVE